MNDYIVIQISSQDCYGSVAINPRGGEIELIVDPLHSPTFFSRHDSAPSHGAVLSLDPGCARIIARSLIAVADEMDRVKK